MEVFPSYSSFPPDPRKNIKREKKRKSELSTWRAFLDVGGDDRQGVGQTTVKDEVH